MDLSWTPQCTVLCLTLRAVGRQSTREYYSYSPQWETSIKYKGVLFLSLKPSQKNTPPVLFTFIHDMRTKMQSCNTSHITFIIHVYCMSWPSRQEVLASELGGKADKPITTVWDCVSTFHQHHNLDTFKPHFWQQNQVFLVRCQEVSSQACGYKRRIFLARHLDIFSHVYSDEASCF